MPMSLKTARRASRWLSAAIVLLLTAATLPAVEIVQTIAGGGSLEGYKPLEANLLLGNGPGVAISPAGELYISDTGHHQVVKINPTTGVLSIVAGNGTASFFGDGLPAISAGLNGPRALAFDGAGNLYIADQENFRIRRVDALTGLISTVAGVGLETNRVVNGVQTPLGDGGPALAASFSNTLGAIVVDAAGTITVADTGSDIIRRFTIGGAIATIAGIPFDNGLTEGPALSARFDAPVGLVTIGGVLYIGDSNNHRIRRLDAAGTVSSVAGSGGGNAAFTGDGGPATSAQIGTISGLAVDKDGALLISCVGADRIRRVDVASAAPTITTIAGDGGFSLGDGGPATSATLDAPRDVAVDGAGNIFIYDDVAERVRRIDAATGFISTVAGTGLRGFIGDRGIQSRGVFVGPRGAAIDAAGNIYVADTGNDAVRKIAPDGTLTTIAGNGTTNGLGDGGDAFLASLSAPFDVAVFGTTLFIADNAHDAIRAVDLATGLISTYVTIPNPRAIAVDATGILYVARDNRIDRVALDKTVTAYAGNAPMNTMANPLGDGLPAANATLGAPRGLALGAAGELYIADTGNDRIRLISAPPAMTVSTFAGGGAPVDPSVGDGAAATAARLNAPGGVAIDGARIVISDTNNQRIRAVDIASNVITTICGTGVEGFAGDGDIAATAQVNSPAEIFVADGGVVFADLNNNRIRKIVNATEIDPKLLVFSAKLSFAIDKKTGALPIGKDSVALSAGLVLPAGINPANLLIRVDVVDLHSQVQLDASGKLPKAVKVAKPIPPQPFDLVLAQRTAADVFKVSFSLKGPSTGDAKPVKFGFSGKGTFRDELGRAGFSNTTTAKEGVNLPVRVNITLGTLTFTGLTTVNYKATQDKGGAGKSVKP